MRHSIATAGRAGLPERVRELLLMKALSHRSRRLHRVDARRAAARDGADVIGIDCFTDYYPRAIKERNLRDLVGRPRVPVRRVAIQDADLPALLADRTHVFHLAAQAGVRKSWGRDFGVYTVNNIEATQVLLEACVGRRSSNSCTRRARRCTATTSRCRCARMRCRSRSRPTG